MTGVMLGLLAVPGGFAGHDATAAPEPEPDPAELERQQRIAAEKLARAVAKRERIRLRNLQRSGGAR